YELLHMQHPMPVPRSIIAQQVYVNESKNVVIYTLTGNAQKDCVLGEGPIRKILVWNNSSCPPIPIHTWEYVKAHPDKNDSCLREGDLIIIHDFLNYSGYNITGFTEWGDSLLFQPHTLPVVCTKERHKGAYDEHGSISSLAYE
ncbi:MAG: hypothetical protein QXS83_01865, partial [Thermoplasmata archaeon]